MVENDQDEKDRSGKDCENQEKLINSVKEENDKDEKIKDIKIMINIRKGEESLIMIKMRMIKMKRLKISKS